MEDVFGLALRDHLDGKTTGAISVCRDDGFVDTHDAGLYFAAAPQAHEASVLKAVAGPVLDIGCGAGRHVLWLQAAGVDVTGLDVSPGAVQVCRRRGCQRVAQADIMDPEAPPGAPFRTALLFGNNIGIGGTVDGTVRMLRRLGAVLEDGGRVLVTSLDVERTSNPAHLAYHARNLDSGRLKGQVRIRLAYGGRVGRWMDWLHPTPGELTALATEAGWSVAQMSRSDSGLYGAVLRPAV